MDINHFLSKVLQIVGMKETMAQLSNALSKINKYMILS